jgi:hypothetical protein
MQQEVTAQNSVSEIRRELLKASQMTHGKSKKKKMEALYQCFEDFMYLPGQEYMTSESLSKCLFAIQDDINFSESSTPHDFTA